MRSRHAEVRCRAGRRLVRELADEQHKRDDRHDPRQDHGDPLARLDGRLEGAKNKLEEEERDERRRRLRGNESDRPRHRRDARASCLTKFFDVAQAQIGSTR